ncbi:Pentatricopeptide repeat superfamily protein [Hibiscus syriacus]|uniref:Pentatricopeptide repeat superfamily protein n=1 Tax=Hibiscus syriacus TaxID=106335 RepID=A0A6A2ZCY7_HIBSY|nr:uncharacterized protein LOC120146756 [Hibiscus syriacus]KAE8689864.1 Pentatricopeptide repeat superfamily protein [Hibiscus syriacus]
MAEEEFQESEVVFCDGTHDGGATVQSDVIFDRRRPMLSRNCRSIPVNIPLHRGNNSIVFDCGDGFDEDRDDGREIVPPHVISGRRIAAKMAFSVCIGNGRTLKGRDLSEVRNSILKLTGFLEA